MNRQSFISRVILLLLCSVAVACGSSSPTAPSSTQVPPQSTGVSPATGVRGTSVPVTLTGAQFAPGATTAVAVSGDGVGLTNVAVQSATTVTATLTIAADAALGARTISVTNTGGTGQGLTFTVLPPPPTLDAVTPLLVQAGAPAVLTLKGTNFVNAGTTVAISGTGLAVADVSVADATTLTVAVNANQTAAIGVRKVTITTAGGTSAEQSLGVMPPPIVVTSVASGRLRMGETTTIRIFGSGFIPGVTTVTSSNPAVKVVAVRVLNAPPSAAPGRARPADVSATGTYMEVDLRAELDQFFAEVQGVVQKFTVSLSFHTDFNKLFDELRAAFLELFENINALLDQLGLTELFTGLSFSLPIEVAPPLPKIGAFEATPSVISQGQSSTLKWRGIEFATKCSISHIGEISCADGSVAVSPTATVEYRLTVEGAGGDLESANATVIVEVPPPPVVTTPTPSTSSTTFTTVGTTQSFTVPAGVSQVTLEVSGGSGGTGAGSTPSNSGAAGGLGGRVTATVAVTPGETLTVMVGGLGSNAVNGGAFGFGGGAGGIGDGANSGNPGLGGGGGGGASSVRRGSTVLAIAGGGGGGGGNAGNTLGGTGGAGGSTGADGNGQTTADSGTGGGGATQSAIGAGGAGAGHSGGNGDPGSGPDGGEGGEGSNASSGAGGGGGGGAFGGGGGGGGALGFGKVSGGGGGGGSSTTIGSATSVTLQRGVQSGNGSVVIRW